MILRSLLLLLLLSIARLSAAEPARIAVIGAFRPELQAFRAGGFELQETRTINGVVFELGRAEGKEVLLFLTGVSMTNAAMTTQLALDRFNVSAVLFTGIAGGINPALRQGDVSIPDRWVQHAEGNYAREVAPGVFKQPSQTWVVTDGPPNFGMFFPQPVDAIRQGLEKPQRMDAFPVDEAMLAAARAVGPKISLPHVQGQPARLVIGGVGIAGPIFMDNREYREWAYGIWKADVLDMESAAIAQVCWANRTPCLIVRGVSDLAGGDEGENTAESAGPLAWNHAALVAREILRSL